VNPNDPCDDASEATDLSALLRRFFPFYCALAALVAFAYALWDNYQLDGDAVAYMDIGDNLRAHHWSGIVNGYWHPMYPAFLSLGHILFHATLATELRAYYFVNFAIFLLEMLAVVCFIDAIMRLRKTLSVATLSAPTTQRIRYLLDRTTLRYLGLTLLVIAGERELSLAKVRPDALLQAFLLFAIAALLAYLASGLLRYAALMGVALGCAYLTKSFAFVFAFLCIFALAAFRWIWLRQRLTRILPATLIAFACFVAVAGPYVAALSHQRHRLDFGDSGALNYAWYVGGTEKMHLQPRMTSQFGSAEVLLKHPEKELLRTPQILSYAQMRYGTYPDWFDTTYWNDQIKPHFKLRDDLPRFARNCVLIVRYLFNHPEALLLLALLLLLGARPALRWRPRDRTANAFWIVPLLLGVVIWGIYALVNTEERYVTVAYLSIILTLFASLRLPQAQRDAKSQTSGAVAGNLRFATSAMILLLALLAIGDGLRCAFEDRRQLALLHSPGGWYSPTMVQVADGLHALGVRPGDAIACAGNTACLNDHYWARLAGVRILTEIYDPQAPVYPFLANLPNREQAIDVVRAQGAKVLVADFGNSRVSDSDPAFRDWKQLGDTTFYALPLH
jgi:4-amino-4-deoxy-L-arabinose transferase-like glycosyltransferase